MKTIQNVNELLSDKLAMLAREKKYASKSKIKRMQKEIRVLRKYKVYLETSPREEMLRDSLCDIQNKIDTIMARYPEWVRYNKRNHEDPFLAYKLEMNIPKMRQQVNTLKFLLNE